MKKSSRLAFLEVQMRHMAATAGMLPCGAVRQAPPYLVAQVENSRRLALCVLHAAAVQTPPSAALRQACHAFAHLL